MHFSPKPFIKKGGFTLIEVILVLGLSIVIATILTLVTAAGLKNIRAARRLERLHSNALFVSDALTFWIKQGEMFTLPAASTLQITLPDSSIKTVAKGGGHVTLNNAVLTTDDTEVTNLFFTRFARSIRVNLALRAENSNETLSVTTTIAQRNSL